MTNPLLSISKLERRLALGGVETLHFEPGVCLLVGRPNTGKTKWLQTLDFLLGDTGNNPYEGAEETGLADKYDSAAADLLIGDDTFHIERRWREAGGKGKVYLDGQAMLAKNFQHWLLSQLKIPLLHFPKGNPMSGQTWPELSFRMLLRHIYRQQRFWSSLVDQQPDAEFHACLLEFLGLGEHIFTSDYGELVNLKLDVERLRARRTQYKQTLNELARDLLSDKDATVDVTAVTVQAAQTHLLAEISNLRAQRIKILESGAKQALTPKEEIHVAKLSKERASTAIQLELQTRQRDALNERAQDIARYRADLIEELARMERAEDAGSILADLKVTHCPACDQALASVSVPAGECFLCHQHLPPVPLIEGMGGVRLQFERNRLSSELEEANKLVDVINRDTARHNLELTRNEEALRAIENELLPARETVAALVQAQVSEIDVALGQSSERQRQLDRIAAALGLETDLNARIDELEKRIGPVKDRVEAALEKIDFNAASGILENGMNAYIDALNRLRPGTWRHSAIRVDISRRDVAFRVGNRRWVMALGGTDSLFFMMAYHYALLSLSPRAGCHYPGLSIIDLPGEFLGEAIEDKENFIVQPFIELLADPQYAGSQLIMTGASFTGLAGAHSQALRHIHVS